MTFLQSPGPAGLWHHMVQNMAVPLAEAMGRIIFNRKSCRNGRLLCSERSSLCKIACPVDSAFQIWHESTCFSFRTVTAVVQIAITSCLDYSNSFLIYISTFYGVLLNPFSIQQSERTFQHINQSDFFPAKRFQWIRINHTFSSMTYEAQASPT